MKQYYIADFKKEDGQLCIVNESPISFQEYSQIRSWFSFAGFYQTCRSTKSMALESATDLEEYLVALQNTKERTPGLPIDNYLVTGNKLLICFLSFIKIFIDVTSNTISNKKDLDEFNEINRMLYDKFFGYRFLTRMRNYVTHFNMPLTTVSDSVSSGITMRCNRDCLLQYKKWSSIKSEIELLPEMIDILPYISETKTAISILYLKSLESVVEQVFKANQNISKVIRDRGISQPIILINDDDAAAPSLEMLPLQSMNDFIVDLSQNPRYTIKIINK